ncbi:MAG: hypothetical protein JNG89_06970 [Planctomycetaceae bacterium]|nr:hypothetical protein [Planctomycetaceae bacterium]
MVAPAQLGPEAIDSLGAAIYRGWITPEIESREYGRFVVFDVVSRDHEIADSDLEASDRLASRRPEGVFWGTRVGRNAAYQVRRGHNRQ